MHFHRVDSIAPRLAIIISNSPLSRFSPAPCSKRLTKVGQGRVLCLYSYGLNKPTTYTSGVLYAPYAYGAIIRTIRVWLYHMRIRVWYVPYAYGINTRMVQNSYTIFSYAHFSTSVFCFLLGFLKN